MKKIDSILFFVDHEEADVRHAERIAEALGAKLTLAAVARPYPSRLRKGSAEIQQLIVDHHQKELQKLDSGGAHATRVLVGRPDEEIIKEVAEGGYDFLLKSPAPDGPMRDRLTGTLDMRLMRASSCPVAVIRPESDGEFKCVVAAVDADDPLDLKQAILEHAAFIRTRGYSELHLVHAWTLYGESMLRSGVGRIPLAELEADLECEKQRRREAMNELMDFMEKQLGKTTAEYSRPELHLIKGDPDTVIPDFLHQLSADLLVIGTKSRAGLPGLLIGNTAEKILTQVNCSVLTVKPSSA